MELMSQWYILLLFVSGVAVQSLSQGLSLRPGRPGLQLIRWQTGAWGYITMKL